MKTKTGLFLLFSLFFQLTLNAQTIEGPQILCQGECGDYQVLDANGVPMNDVFTWDFGNGGTQTGASVFWCDFFDNVLITASLNGNVIAELFIFVDYCCLLPFIDGPSEVCVGECVSYDVSGGIAPYTFEFGDGSNTSMLCPSSPGTYQLIVTDNNGCTVTMTINAFDVGTPEIISLSGAFCLDDPGSNCDRVCENTTES